MFDKKLDLLNFITILFQTVIFETSRTFSTICKSKGAYMHISRINSIGFKYNTQLSSVPKKHSSQPVQAQIQPALTPSLEQMQSFVNLSFKGHSTPVHDEVFHIFLYDDESLEMMAKDSPDEFK